MKVNITTGYGYVLNPDGSFNFKYEQFQPGIHDGFPDGVTVHEMPDSESLNALPICQPVLTPQAKLENLNAEYQPGFDSLSLAYGKAMLANDDATMADVKAEYDALLAEYNVKKAAIK